MKRCRSWDDEVEIMVCHTKHLGVDDAAVGNDVELEFDWEGGDRKG